MNRVFLVYDSGWLQIVVAENEQNVIDILVANVKAQPKSDDVDIIRTKNIPLEWIVPVDQTKKGIFITESLP